MSLVDSLLKLIFLLLAFALDSITVDPEKSVSIIGIHVDTFLIIEKIENAFINYDLTYGRLIHFKKGGRCLETNVLCDPQTYCVSLLTCNSSPTQQWRLVGDRIEAASKQHLPKINSLAPCLDNNSSLPDGQVNVFGCHSEYHHQEFKIRVHSSQIDLTHNRIYFSIHNKIHAGRCLSYYLDSELNVERFRLQDCAGTDDQSFYLDIDFTKEVADIRKKILGT